MTTTFNAVDGNTAPTDWVKLIIEKNTGRSGEFLESWVQWRLLQERRIPAQVEKELR